MALNIGYETFIFVVRGRSTDLQISRSSEVTFAVIGRSNELEPKKSHKY